MTEMIFEFSLQTTSLLIGAVGAVTGIVSLIWHMLNSRSKVVLNEVSFVRMRKHGQTEKEVIDISINIRNIGNRSTTIEDIILEIGNISIPSITSTSHHIGPNSSYKLHFYQNFNPKEFKELLKKGGIKLGVTIVHTFGILRKYGWTDFSTDYLNL